MKKLFSIKYSAGAFNTALLLLRLTAGLLIISHGYDKLVDFENMKTKFIDFMGIGPSISLGLTIFAEFFCGILIVIGLFTRFAAIPLIIVMCVIIFNVTNADFFGKSEMAVLYLGAFLTILLVGPGRVSIDSLINK